MRAMHTSFDDTLAQRIVDDLAEHGWSRQDCCVPDLLTAALAQECRRRAAVGELAPAAVGRGDAQEVRESIRGDLTQWIDPGEAPCTDRYLALMDTLREALNRGLFLGLEDFECHFALYPAGAFYKRHLDRFRDDDRRMVSAVLYLNPNWDEGDGGELRLYFKDGSTLDVPPRGGCLVVFLSGELPHEVLPTGCERLSLTGWFRRRGNEPF
ncbi:MULTISPECIES: 2OG-Fe(II) oxygenase [unclassified Pseudomonas]|uniref:2OG-Fe(II) oxygenase n=1 Tax=unclassified Pseudomonas TaxID=196821 RepID=UPI000BC4C15D|nr:MULTISPECIES: 2OG-Fe(II) oxygenase [unclassified Pseudomonas]PVZ15445.1 SM-20-related protein [Pseudomonas sp. URIL14HWK12:I12]PVZ24819.1 SM-20-related protein [Pseudomonas sp. URIL14HWK12:I10]PVZ34665.1 SM-20-related protein [Pseudomonas sp. URIL14HWK12:I11]SNZ08900.1 SM-20-related protein [Pseudomonas sp. URIL14HWK12:I9]